MRWLLAGLLFALTVALAASTAALRAENVHYRRLVDQALRDIGDRNLELTRLSVERLHEATPERLAEVLWRHLRAEAARRMEALQ